MGLTKDEARELYERELERIERAIRFTCRRNALSPDEAEEFRAETHLRFLEDDCAILRALEDRQALPAFIGVVIQRLMLDFRAQRWGKWRPSVAARRSGEVAILLETLVVRDRIDFGQAWEILRRNYRVTESRDELYALLQTFPHRHGLASHREVALDEDQAASPSDTPEAHLVDAQRAATERALERCLGQAFGDLAAEDRLLLRMVYLEGHTVATVARALQLEQKPLYRRLERLHGSLREVLEREGIGPDRWRELLRSRKGLQELDLGRIIERRPSSSVRRGDEALREPAS